MKNFLITVAIAGAALLASCEGNNPFPGYDEAGNGSYFKLHSKGTGTTTVDTGGAIFVKIKFKTDKDSVFLDINQQTQSPSYPMRVDNPAFPGDFLDMFMRLHSGDSASFFVSLDSLKKYYPEEFNFGERFGSQLDTMAYLGFSVKVDSIYPRTKVEELRKKIEAEQKQQQEMINAMAAEEPGQIAKYIADNKITVQPTASGLYYIEKSKGKGENVKPGQLVSVKYTGKFLDGEVFDSSERAGKPFEFVVGQGQVIPGMDEAMQLMKKGGKATVIIPSKLAYGQGGGMMKPFATLVFDLELLDVKEAPPMPPMQGPPGGVQIR